MIKALVAKGILTAYRRGRKKRHIIDIKRAAAGTYPRQESLAQYLSTDCRVRHRDCRSEEDP
jgi:hypothetical protein